MINVTKPFLPNIEEYNRYIQDIWKRGWLTNNGPLVNELELKLKEYLNVPHLLFLGNGTIAIQIAIKALDLKGEIITTPFSYVATTSSIVWENCTPVFADIDPLTLNIDPAKVEAAITPATTGILATHVFGNPCDIDALEKIAKKHNLKVIYDAAHCFGSKYKNKSVFAYGDVATTSFHATKLFHSIEGGAVFTNSAEVLKVMSRMRNFGHNGPEQFMGVGINGKNSEFHGAMGLVNLNYVNDIIADRKRIWDYYNKMLTGLKVKKPTMVQGGQSNYSYYPVIFESEQVLLEQVETLNANWVYPRRYFYPSLSSLDYVKAQSTPISDDISKRILCLPVFYGMTSEEIDLVCRLLLRTQNN